MYYLGETASGDLIRFQSASRPTRESTGGRFKKAIGPLTLLGAAYYARYGRFNGTSLTDVERMALEDTNPCWLSQREQLEVESIIPRDELIQMYRDEACEYKPDKIPPGRLRPENLYPHSC